VDIVIIVAISLLPLLVVGAICVGMAFIFAALMVSLGLPAEFFFLWVIVGFICEVATLWWWLKHELDTYMEIFIATNS